MSEGLPGPLPGYKRQRFTVDLVDKRGRVTRKTLEAFSLREAQATAHRRFSATHSTIQTRPADS